METTIKVRSVEDYLYQVFQKTARKDNKEDVLTFWFRGESSINFKTPLVPNAYRVLADTLMNMSDDKFNSKLVKRIESNIIADFDRMAFPYIISKGINNNLWNRYFLMQHYHINTRLLDWTENALIALFFAVSDNHDTDAVVWILHPFRLNNLSINNILGSDKNYAIIPPISNSLEKSKLLNKNRQVSISEILRRYLKMDFETKDSQSTGNYYPIGFYPKHLDERMAAQKTCFTIFGNKLNGLMKLPNHQDTIIDSIIISREKKREIIKELRISGINHYSIYPDLDGIGLSIMSEYSNFFFDNSETLGRIIEEYSKGTDDTTDVDV